MGHHRRNDPCGLCACIVCSGPIGLILVIAGFAMLASSMTDTRGAAIDTYVERVDMWVNEQRGAFAEASEGVFASVEKQTSCDNSVVVDVDMEEITSGTISDGDARIEGWNSDTDTAPIPDALYYQGEEDINMTSNEESDRCELDVTFQSDPVDLNPWTILMGGIDLKQKREVNKSDLNCRNYDDDDDGYDSSECEDNCHYMGGEWMDNSSNKYNHYCEIEWYLQEVCVKTKVIGADTLDVDAHFPPEVAGNGCYIKGGSASTTKYGLNKYPISFSLKSSYDPYLNFMAITGGSGSFGMTQGQKRSAGISLVFMGFLAIFFFIGTGTCIFKTLRGKDRPTTRPNGMHGMFYDVSHKYGSKYVRGGPPPVQQPGMVQMQQPGMVQMQQPGMIMQQPGMVMQQPGMVMQQPGMVMQQPGMVMQQQPGIVMQQQPGMVMQQQPGMMMQPNMMQPQQPMMVKAP